MPSFNTVKALFVDDSLAERESIKALLLDEKIECITASTGTQALNLLQTPEGADIGLVITDQRMQGNMPGSRLLQLIRSVSGFSCKVAGIRTGGMERQDIQPLLKNTIDGRRPIADFVLHKGGDPKEVVQALTTLAAFAALVSRQNKNVTVPHLITELSILDIPDDANFGKFGKGLRPEDYTIVRRYRSIARKELIDKFLLPLAPELAVGVH